jgi:hypothetical protein
MANTAQKRATRPENEFMVLILLEALGALILLLLIVWWTMFSGRKNGELPDQQEPSPEPEEPAVRNPDNAPQSTDKPP